MVNDVLTLGGPNCLYLGSVEADLIVPLGKSTIETLKRFEHVRTFIQIIYLYSDVHGVQYSIV